MGQTSDPTRDDFVIDYWSNPKVEAHRSGGGWHVQASAGMYHYGSTHTFTRWGAKRAARRLLASMQRQIKQRRNRERDTIRFTPDGWVDDAGEGSGG